MLAADIDPAAAERSAELARAVGATAHSYCVDVGDSAAMERFAQWVKSSLGVPDVVVSNAGIGMAGPMLKTTPQEWERLLRINLWSVIDGCRLFGKQMVEAGKPGHLVNVASGVAFAPSRNYPAYATSKAAVLMLSECLRAELAGNGIGVSAACPALSIPASSRPRASPAWMTNNRRNTVPRCSASTVGAASARTPSANASPARWNATSRW